jgi:hypothetical protein
MAGFCRNCGTPLGDAQAFCAKCGTKVGQAPAASAPAQAAPPAAPSATPVAPPAPVAAAAAPVAAASGGGGALVKILLIVVAVIFLLGAIGVGSVMYIGYRFRQKAREMGLKFPSEGQHSSTLHGVDGCQWLSNDDVSAAIGMTVAHADSESGDSAGCVYTVAADATELTMKHMTQINKSQTSQMSKADQEKMENFGKTMLKSGGAPSGNSSEHSGETAVIAFTVDENNAQFQMNLNKGLLSRLGPVATKNIPDLGDEAFDVAGAMLFVRKGDKLLRITYTQCPCGLDGILPLARTLTGHL